MTDEDSWEGYDTGPFCRHWAPPGDCEEKCATCGHKCGEHGDGSEDEPCDHDACACERWAGAKMGEGLMWLVQWLLDTEPGVFSDEHETEEAARTHWRRLMAKGVDARVVQLPKRVD